MGSFETVLNIYGSVAEGSLSTEHARLLGVVALGTFQELQAPSSNPLWVTSGQGAMQGLPEHWTAHPAARPLSPCQPTPPSTPCLLGHATFLCYTVGDIDRR